MVNKDDEQILAIRSDVLFQDGKWQGLKTENLDYYIDLIKKNAEFKRRGDIENSPFFQQIIPYILFSYKDEFFAYKYLSSAGEQRLVNNNYQLGIGGHINKNDVNGEDDVLETGMMREWEEEVHFRGRLLEKKFVGIINDDSNPVEQVHIGLVYHFIGDSPEIYIEETDKMEGKLINLKELENSVSHSVWMSIVYNEYLNKPSPDQRDLFPIKEVYKQMATGYSAEDDKEHKKKGMFYVLEGIDGCGKSTQTKLLAEHFRQKGFEVERIDFPQHGQRSSAIVDDYLIGKYGSSAEVGPYIASIFYAVDRYDASFKIRKWLDEGKIVISDRYLVSNIGHQGGKLIHNKEEWKKYVNWLYNLEYGIFKIPKPDYTFILKTSAEFSLKLANNITDKEKVDTRKSYLGDDKNQDIHEKDTSHLENALTSYLMASEEFPNDFKVIECLETQMSPPDVINKKIIKEIP